jgi:heavy metal sensor kinase
MPDRPFGLRSLRARLLAWYSLVLVGVLATFAAASAFAQWRSGLRDLDARLLVLAAALGRSVAVDPSGGYEVNIAGQEIAGQDTSEDSPYYAVWDGSGALIDRSDPRVDHTFPRTAQVRTREGRREVVAAADDHALVLVGQSLGPLRAAVSQSLMRMAGAGLAALALALAGGWFIAGRALAPIRRIGDTAEAMSESNLGLRIDVSQTADELSSVGAALNRAFDRLQEAFERQTRFTADASHELRTPLAALLAEVEWALARPRSEAEYRDALRVSLRAGQRMRSVVEGLLTLARADAGAVELTRETVDLRELCAEIVQGVAPAAAPRDMQIRVEGGATLVSGDPDRLRELVTNLVANAVQHGTPGGRVTCSVSMSGRNATLVVADTGPGIDANDLPHVFERFYRANKARSRSGGGAGLGLAISKWIAEAHGGDIRCESEPGRGSRFVVTLPVTVTPSRATVTTEN